MDSSKSNAGLVDLPSASEPMATTKPAKIVNPYAKKSAPIQALSNGNAADSKAVAGEPKKHILNPYIKRVAPIQESSIEKKNKAVAGEPKKHMLNPYAKKNAPIQESSIEKITKAGAGEPKQNIVNPYAKKNATIPFSSIAQHSAEETKKNIVNPYAKKKVPVQSSSIEQLCKEVVGESSTCDSSSFNSKKLVVVDHGPNLSFSQAFSSIQDTEQYENEYENLRKKGALAMDSATNEDDRKKQREIDAPLNGADVDAREHHAHLQPHVLHVSRTQQGNPILKHIRNVPFAFSKIVPDYIIGPNRCALFLSLRYHSLHPEYIHRRISELKSDFMLRVLLVLVDVEDNSAALLVLNKLAVLQNMALVLAWSNEEAGRYLETFKAFESKDASLIQKKEKDTFADQITDVICTIRSVNKTDVSQLMSQFGSFHALAVADMDELSLVPGIGSKKVKRLYEAFHKPFSADAARKRKMENIATGKTDETETDFMM